MKKLLPLLILMSLVSAQDDFKYRTMVGVGDGYLDFLNLNPTISIRLNQSPYFKNLPTTQYLTIGHGLDDWETYNITYGMLESHLELQNDLAGISLFAGAGLGLWNDGNLGDFNLSGILHPNGVGYMLTGGERLRVWRLPFVGVRINKPNVVKKMFPSIHIGYQSKLAARAFVPPKGIGLKQR